MHKLIHGILEFRKQRLQHYLDQYSHLATRQSPDGILITCSDSRVAPNVFASTNPGDLFVVRNVGNIVPRCSCAQEGSSEAAALSFALSNLPIKDIIVCGHSDCGAMRALLAGIDHIQDPHLKGWLQNCDVPISQISSHPAIQQDLLPWNQLSQLNILQQIAHLKTYPAIQQKIAEDRLSIHGWYFDLGKGDLYCFEEEFNRFTLIDEEEGLRILNRLK